MWLIERGLSRYGRPIERLVLLTAASGYVGGRLLSVLEGRGERVRCLRRIAAGRSRRGTH